MYLQSSIEAPASKRQPYRKRTLEFEASDCDRALVRRAQSGEHQAFNLLVSKYRRRIMNLAMRYTRNRADAEDAVQETFIKAHWGLKHFRGNAAFYSWLYRIGVNAAKTALSLRARNARVFMPDATTGEDTDGSPLVVKDLDSPEELCLTEEICAAVDSAIEELCEEQRTAIKLRELQGLSYSRVAVQMSCPVGTVRSRVFRAREAIDSRLRRVFDDGLGRQRRI